MKICLIAGESSGDDLGAHLMTDLKARRPDLEFFGVGGPLMAGQGLDSLFPMSDLSVMGLAEILPRLPLLMRRIRQTADHIQAMKPDIVVTIDSPDFCFRVVRLIRDMTPRPRLVHYVAPTVWAWRPERAAKIAALYDGLICLLPFEPPYFEKEGLSAVFAGHPLTALTPDPAAGAAFRAAHDITPEARVLGLFFGSRMGELNRMGPVLREAACRLAERNTIDFIVSPTLPHLEREAKNMLRAMPCKTLTLTGVDNKHAAMKAMNVALATSGTVGLELAMAGVPHAIGYRMSPLTFQIVRRKVRVRHAHLVNILLGDGRDFVPEFIQDLCTPDNLVGAIENSVKESTQIPAFQQARRLLTGQVNAADFILSSYSRSFSGT